MGPPEVVDREFLYIEFCLVPRNSTRRRPAPAPQGSVDNLVADVLQWQKEIGEARLPEQSAKASAKESNLAKRWSKLANRPDISAEDLVKLQSVPAPQGVPWRLSKSTNELARSRDRFTIYR